MNRSQRKKGRRGFSLIEVLLAMAIVALSFLVTYGLITNAMLESGRLIGETKSTAIMAKILADLKTGVTAHLTSTPIYHVALPGSVSATPLSADSAPPYYFFDSTGVYLGSSASYMTGAAFRVTVALNRVSLTPNNIFQVHVVAYWPAGADPTTNIPNSVDVLTEISD